MMTTVMITIMIIAMIVIVLKRTMIVAVVLMFHATLSLS